MFKNCGKSFVVVVIVVVAVVDVVVVVGQPDRSKNVPPAYPLHNFCLFNYFSNFILIFDIIEY